ncbi:helix-turn-helix domain-containing protein [Spirosoma lituiforme]
MQDKLTVRQMLTACALSERSFIRRFKAATGRTPSEYIQLVKVEQAKLMLEESGQSIKEVSFRLGYDDLTYFRTLFKRHSGLTPVEYRRRFAG